MYTFNELGQLSGIRHETADTSTLIEEIAYTLDEAGRATSATFALPGGVPAEQYSYTEFGQIERVVYSETDDLFDATDRTVVFVYNKNGGRTEMTDDPDGSGPIEAEVTTYELGAGNRLMATRNGDGVVTVEYFYDEHGNLVTKVTDGETVRYEFHDQDRMTAYWDGDTLVEFEYDGAGRRVGKDVNGQSTEYVLDVSSAIYQVLEEYVDDAISANYIYGQDRLAGNSAGGASQYYLADRIGSVRVLTDATGAALGYGGYDVFGRLQPGSSVTLADGGFGFAGEMYDAETGLTYLRARYLDSEVGRFTAKDPMEFVDSWDTYLYVASDPVNRIDPTGMLDLGSVEGVMNLPVDLVTGGGFYPTNIGGIVGRDFSDHELSDIMTIASDEGSSERYESQIAYWNHDNALKDARAVDESAKWFNLAHPAVRDAHWALATESPDRAIKGLFGTMTGAGNVMAAAGHLANTVVDAVGGFVGSIVDTVSNFFAPPPPPGAGGGGAAVPSVGGVLIDKAAELVGSSIDDIAGVTFDPESGQLVFLGTQDPASTKDVNLDFLFTSIQSVYGSIAPPYVTLDPPGKLLTSSFDLGSGTNVLPAGQSASIVVKYNPLVPTETDDMTLNFRVDGADVEARINGWLMDGSNAGPSGSTLKATGGGRYGMGLTIDSTQDRPSGLEVTMPPMGGDLLANIIGGNIVLQAGGAINVTGGEGYTLRIDAYGQDSYWFVTFENNSGSAMTFDNFKLVPDLQHRGLSERAEGTMLGWVMYEADRVMKNLGIGEDMLTGADYNRTNPDLPVGFENLMEKFSDASATGHQDNRFWFTPNEMALKRYIDPATGEATIVFDEASVVLQTESELEGHPVSSVAQEFADFFNDHYDEFADIEFPVQDPSDPTGATVINVKIFELLRDAMKSVSLARFFRDNSIPLDTWWLNSYQPEEAYVPETIPTMSSSMPNGSGGIVSLWGGVQIAKPNSYIPDVVAQSIANQVNAARPDNAGDLDAQQWAANSTSLGDLQAVALNLSQQDQDANVAFVTTDLAFAAPGDEQLALTRFYNSGYLGEDILGAGWQPLRYELQFQMPTWTDEYNLMRDADGEEVNAYGMSFNTRMREGEIRYIDYATGAMLNFHSSFDVDYAIDSFGEPILDVDGLNDDDVPTFTPGVYDNGSTLEQLASGHDYRLTRPDGSSVEFDYQGRLTVTTDSRRLHGRIRLRGRTTRNN